ncbi:MAG: restriction endonuclease subunit S [Mediterraneibacter sp.]
MRYKLGELVDKIVGNEDRFNTNLKYYIGGEHMDSGSIAIYRKGLLDSDKGRTLGYQFHYPFEPGDVLFMTKNPYLKKCARVDFSGICSIATFVIRTKDESILSQDFLPLLLQTDRFWDYLEANKSGSVNYFITWKTLEKYEVDLPSYEEQIKMAEVAWSMEHTRRTYLRLLRYSELLVQARFTEMFGDYSKNTMSWPIAEFKDFASIDANMTTDYETYADYPHIGIDSIEKDTGRLFGYRTVKEDNVISGKYIFTPRHIIYSKIRPNLNKVALPDFDGLCSADAYPILPNEKNCDRIYLATLMRSRYFLDYILGFSVRAGMPKVNRKQIEGFRAPLPPLELQREFATFFRQTDESESELQNAISGLSVAYKRVIADRIGGE